MHFSKDKSSYFVGNLGEEVKSAELKKVVGAYQ